MRRRRPHCAHIALLCAAITAAACGQPDQEEEQDPGGTLSSNDLGDVTEPNLIPCSLATAVDTVKEVGSAADTIVIDTSRAERFVSASWEAKGNATSEVFRVTVPAESLAAVDLPVPRGRLTEVTLSYSGCEPGEDSVIVFRRRGQSSNWEPLTTRKAAAMDSAVVASVRDPEQPGPGQAVASAPGTVPLAPSSRFALGTN